MDAFPCSLDGAVDPTSRTTKILTDYDRTHMLTYARLLDAERDGYPWSDAAAEILLVDVDAAERCWRSHLDRAHWIVGAGLATAIADG